MIGVERMVLLHLASLMNRLSAGKSIPGKSYAP